MAALIFFLPAVMDARAPRQRPSVGEAFRFARLEYRVEALASARE